MVERIKEGKGRWSVGGRDKGEGGEVAVDWREIRVERIKEGKGRRSVGGRNEGKKEKCEKGLWSWWQETLKPKEGDGVVDGS